LDTPHISPLVTPNKDFYRIDTALSVPRVDGASIDAAVSGTIAWRGVTLLLPALAGLGSWASLRGRYPPVGPCGEDSARYPGARVGPN
jgi:hypothetical protein